MPIKSISIERFRNLQPVELECSPRLNLFYGQNAAGKTSILEALYVLARGRSFRARQLDTLVQTDTDGFRLVVWLSNPDGRPIPVGMERKDSRLVCRVDGQPVRRLSDLAALFPVQWLGGNLHAVIEDGPAYRRQILDWGLFHVKPVYMDTWKRFQKLIKQRNAALRQGRSVREIQIWDSDLENAGEQLDRMRSAYLQDLIPELQTIHTRFPALEQLAEVKYRRGWAEAKSYGETLADNLASDRDSGFTRAGPHRAELLFHYGDSSARDNLSRGQQKIFVTALQVAQASLLHKETGKISLFLLDDLGAELDAANQQSILSLLRSIQAQVFVTSISDVTANIRDSSCFKRFHVKHGVVSEVV